MGFAPEVKWYDRAKVHTIEPEVCVPAGCYRDVLVIDETADSEPGAHQYKYYARGVGDIKIGWGGDDLSREVLELVKIVNLDEQRLEEVRREVLDLESRAYRISKNVYAKTEPMIRP
ncbi:hypothetical protein [Streptomyces anulatus]|uniref:hypothetical protein n=1 Tax=Streptomyces anulatus TaxID=1892 RepID=UPI003431E73D